MRSCIRPRLDGSDVKRLTNNEVYDAEVAVSPDGKWILWARQIDGQSDLWRMPADGSGEEQQITFTKGEQEGGAFYLPDSETVIVQLLGYLGAGTTRYANEDLHDQS